MSKEIKQDQKSLDNLYKNVESDQQNKIDVSSESVVGTPVKPSRGKKGLKSFRRASTPLAASKENDCEKYFLMMA